MTTDNSSPVAAEFTHEEIAELVRGIDRKEIIDLVNHTSHLKRHVFRGFRPTRLPWSIVPDKLAQDAQGEIGKLATLIERWQKSNQLLVEKVANTPTDQLRESILDLLGDESVARWPQILWALRLDNRSEAQKLLEEGLGQELTHTTSSLINQALRKKLEGTHRELDEALATIAELKDINEQKEQETAEWQMAYKEAVNKQEQLQAHISQHQETINELEQELEYERAQTRELRQSLANLKATLRRQAEAAEGRDDALLELEEERKTSSTLRLKIEKLEQQLNIAYQKRDEALEEVAFHKERVKDAEHDKEVIITQKRDLQTRVEALRTELRQLRDQHEQQAIKELLPEAPTTDLAESWLSAREEIRDHIRKSLSVLAGSQWNEPTTNKMKSWRKWVEQESAYVEKMLKTLETYPETQTLPPLQPITRAQQLLAIRWYLLEYTRRAIMRAQEEDFPV